MPLCPETPTIPPSGTSCISLGILKTSQCRKTPSGFTIFGTSGSSMTSTNDLVPSGAPATESGGETSSASHVYSEGMGSPLSNAALGGGGGGAWGVVGL